MNTPKSTATALPCRLFWPARSWIHWGWIRWRIMPTMKTPTTSSKKICLTNRQDSHSQACQSSARSRRAYRSTTHRASATANARPVSPTCSPPAWGVSRKAATSKVAAASPRAIQVQRLAPSTMFSKPFHAVAPISPRSTISSDPCTLTPSSPLAASKGTQRNRVACQSSIQGSGRLTEATVVVSGHSFNVPAVRRATRDSSTPTASGPMLAWSAKRVSVWASWLTSSRQNSRAISKPMPMPNSRHSRRRAAANSAPRMLPV